ncbi:MAG TPA: hypothetical protein VFD57_07220 [Clostridia bacterium]|nr:hypothetical protein [Clostridia bacterium]
MWNTTWWFKTTKCRFDRAVERIDGELYVILCQKAPEGHWTGKDMEYMDSIEYDPNKLYIKEKTPEEIGEMELT